jgi:signal transduction histidine kinase
MVADPVRRSRILLALREAGFSVSESTEATAAGGSPLLAYREEPGPAFLVRPANGGASGGSAPMELALPAAPEPGELVAIARALSQLIGAGILFNVGADTSPPPKKGNGAATSPMDRLCHDLRTPLSAMLGRLFIMQSGKLSEADMKRSIEKLQANVQEQVELIDRVRAEGPAS